jgi:uncharacterized membrane protein YgcG
MIFQLKNRILRPFMFVLLLGISLTTLVSCFPVPMRTDIALDYRYPEAYSPYDNGYYLYPYLYYDPYFYGMYGYYPGYARFGNYYYGRYYNRGIRYYGSYGRGGSARGFGGTRGSGGGSSGGRSTR